MGQIFHGMRFLWFRNQNTLMEHPSKGHFGISQKLRSNVMGKGPKGASFLGRLSYSWRVEGSTALSE